MAEESQHTRHLPSSCLRLYTYPIYNFEQYVLLHTWFMPALAKRSVGSSWGTTGLDFQKVCSCLSVKNEMNESRTRDAGQPLSENSDTQTKVLCFATCLRTKAAG